MTISLSQPVSSMTSSCDFWTPSLKNDFHQSIASLRRLTEVPSEPRTYRELPASKSGDHQLSIKDELQIADCISFLAHCEEGAVFVSTVTLREDSDRLEVVLAGNTTPSASVGDGITKVMAKVSQLSIKEQYKHTSQDELLDLVLRLCIKRVLSRLRPPWVARPKHIKTPQHSLQSQIKKYKEEMQSISQRTPQIAQVVGKLSALLEALKLIDKKLDTAALLGALKTIVGKCADIARLGTAKSVEEHLRFLGIPESISNSPGIRQIDKLARYLFACRDLASVARKPKYQRLFSHIDITLLESPLATSRPGCAQRCFVHAEVQQIIALEKQSHRPAPRAIGCSKSACYLCDLFIRKHGKYVVSQTHGRLYEKWTIPDAKWMTTTQAASFRSVVESMMHDIQDVLEKFKDKQRYTKRQDWAPYPLESRACLPLSSNSNLSFAKQPMKNEARKLEAESTNSFDAIQSQLRCHSWPMVIPPLIKISETDLPWSRYVRMSQKPLNVQVDRLSLHIEFATTAIGLLSISFYRASSSDGINIIDVLEIPTGSQLDIRDSRASRKVVFCIRFGSARVIQIEFTWEEFLPV